MPRIDGLRLVFLNVVSILITLKYGMIVKQTGRFGPKRKISLSAERKYSPLLPSRIGIGANVNLLLILKSAHC